MTRTQVIGYSRALRAMLWERQKQPLRALTDLRDSISMYPESGLARNNLPWLVATVDLPDRAKLFDEALQQAEKTVELRRDANRLDTVACVFALRGAFDRAIEVENDAISLGGSTPTLRERLIRLDGSGIVRVWNDRLSVQLPFRADSRRRDRALWERGSVLPHVQRPLRGAEADRSTDQRRVACIDDPMPQ
jgi:hypothetical protein